MLSLNINYNVHRSTISHLWQRYLQTETSNDRLQTGRPRISTVKLNQYILCVLTIKATGQFRQHRLLQAYTALAEYPHKQCGSAFEKLGCESDDLILVLFRKTRSACTGRMELDSKKMVKNLV